MRHGRAQFRWRGWLATALAVVLAGGLGACATGSPAATSALAVNASPPAAAANDPRSECPQIRTRIARQLELMLNAANAAKAQSTATPNTLVNAVSRIFGSGHGGMPALADYEREKRTAESLNATLTARGCATVDLEKDGAASRTIVEGLKK